ncbi:tyrosine-type recombinase/integrase [Rhodohalobacter sp. SW132]|uniref:tyrosine-type recombinase/integrase n=1 Tax=Rhodohalobacter sp. SW132 TaxID=2293433 RepID=UPI0032AF4E1C
MKKNLKQICEPVDTGTEISFQMARHSFADLTRSKGWRINDISKALGHTNIRVTEQ